jgi:outer membrane protein W
MCSSARRTKPDRDHGSCARHLPGVMAFLIVFASSSRAGEEGGLKSWLFTFHGTLTTGSQLFPNPNAADDFLRSDFVPIDNAIGYGGEVRYLIPDTYVAVGLGVEYLRKTTQTRFLTTATRGVSAEDGFQVIPVELTGYFIIPVSGPTFSLYMGGGAGGYFGKRIYSVNGVSAATVKEGRGFGIHVLAGLSFTFKDVFVLSLDMKFRDLQFETDNQFPNRSGSSVPLPPAAFPSQVHTDGVVFLIGTGICF